MTKINGKGDTNTHIPSRVSYSKPAIRQGVKAQSKAPVDYSNLSAGSVVSTTSSVTPPLASYLDGSLEKTPIGLQQPVPHNDLQKKIINELALKGYPVPSGLTAAPAA